MLEKECKHEWIKIGKTMSKDGMRQRFRCKICMQIKTDGLINEVKS